MKYRFSKNSKENIVRISALKFFTDHILMFAILYIYQEFSTEKKNMFWNNKKFVYLIFIPKYRDIIMK